MHPEAMAYVETVVANLTPRSVLDVGGRNVNGSPRRLFPKVPYLALDVEPGDGVDIVADASDWEPSDVFDLVLCLEVFEHAPDWRDVLATCCRASSGVVIVTAATDPRAPHSVDGGPLRDGEFYANIHPVDLRTAAEDAGLDVVNLSTHPRGDVYLHARVT